MPKYVYECSDCEQRSKVWHSVDEEVTECPLCKSKQIKRIPGLLNVMSSTKTQDRKTGSYVKEFIEDTRKLLEEERKEMRKDYKVINDN